MDSASPKTSSLVLSSLPSPAAGELLKRRVVSWSLETGLPASVRVRIDTKNYNLHKNPLQSKSGYFKKALVDSQEIDLPENFPGGSEVFEMIALFSYGSCLAIDPFNAAALRCAAEFLEMLENYSTGNLCERSDSYLNRVVLQNWDDTLIVLQKCQALLPWAEDLLIVSRCVESLAFMSCMEILDPDQRREKPVATLQDLAGKAWNCETVKAVVGQELWIKDLIALPFMFFKRIIGSLKRQGMEEKLVSPIIVFYANKWVLSRKTHQFWENLSDKDGNEDANTKISNLLQGIIELLPVGNKAGKAIPVGFYFTLLSRSLNLSLSDESEKKILDQIASMLYSARIDDLLLPDNGVVSIASRKEVDLMQKIFSICVSSNSTRIPIVADLWDEYLSRIAIDPNLSPRRFTDLVEIIPISDRRSHDHLYGAMNTFLLEHPHISQEEKASVCKYLNCQKLSQEIRNQAVQNEQMPLRLIVQALFVQQLNTHQAFRDCSNSLRCGHFCELPESLPSSSYQQPNNQILTGSPYNTEIGEVEKAGKPLGFLLEKDLAIQRSELMREDLESTSFRIQSLEQELMSLKKTFQCQKGSDSGLPSKTPSFRLFSLESRKVGKKGNTHGQVGSCIGSVNWASQRKYANRLMKVFQRLAMFGRGKSRRKERGSGFSGAPNSNMVHQMRDVYDC